MKLKVFSCAGANGYFNGVSELNNICSTLFTDSRYAKEVRSVNVQDWNEIVGKTYAEANHNTGEQTYSYSSDFEYCINESNKTLETLSSGDTRTVNEDYYEYYVGDIESGSQVELIDTGGNTFSDEWTSGGVYWLASPCCELRLRLCFLGLADCEPRRRERQRLPQRLSPLVQRRELQRLLRRSSPSCSKSWSPVTEG